MKEDVKVALGALALSVLIVLSTCSSPMAAVQTAAPMDTSVPAPGQLTPPCPQQTAPPVQPTPKVLSRGLMCLLPSGKFIAALASNWESGNRFAGRVAVSPGPAPLSSPAGTSATRAYPSRPAAL